MSTPGPDADPRHPLIEQLGAYARLMRLDRPIGNWLLLWPALWALWLAGEGRPDPHVFTVIVLGVLVMRAAGCVINDFADRGLDGHVWRTRDRPLATGAVTPAEALVLFAGLGLIAIGLVLTLNPLTRWLAVIGALLTVVYPFTKRFIHTPQFVLGLAFGWAVPMAFAAQLGEVPRLAWLTYCSVILWAVVYDTMYAMADRDDDIRMGMKSTAILFGDADRAMLTALQVLLLLVLALVGHNAGLGGWYLSGIGAAAAFALWQHWLIREREPRACFRAFLNNNFFGAAIFAGIMLDYTFRLPPG